MRDFNKSPGGRESDGAMGDSPVPYMPAGYGYREGTLHCGDLDLSRLAERFGTPLYVYHLGNILERLRALRTALRDRDLVCFAVKANDNLGVLAELARTGAGFDVVSIGELERALTAGAAPERIVFSGVGKRDDELGRAVELGIRSINVESTAEAERLLEVAARLGRRPRVTIRVNPEVAAETHPHIATATREAKFGVALPEARTLCRRLADAPDVELTGLGFHVGSQLTSLDPILDALEVVLGLHDELADAGLALDHLDVGGGLGIRYRGDESPPPASTYAEAVLERLGDRDLDLLTEPGRFLVGESGILLTRLLYRKQGAAAPMAVVDAAMSELMRPALYGAHHPILPVSEEPERSRAATAVVGPVCESADVFASDAELPEVARGDLLALLSAGAYGSTMASNYNSRPRPAEVLVDGNRVALLRSRERVSDLLARDRDHLDWEEPRE